MVNAQTWLDEKFPNQESKIKVKQLYIYSYGTYERSDENKRVFDKTPLEGELYLNNFINLNDLIIIGNDSNFNKLNSLKFEDCGKLNNFTLRYNDGELSFRGNSAPNDVNIQYCKNLSDLQLYDQFANITKLDIHYCELTTLSKLDRLVNLNKLNISNNHKLTRLEGLNGMEELRSFTLSYCPKLEEIVSGMLPRLTDWNISYCSNLKEIIVSGMFPILTKWNISYCSNLKEIIISEKLPKLTELTISICPSLEKINGLEHAPNLYEINFSQCPKLKPFVHNGDWEEEIKEFKELFSLICPNSAYNFANLKEEVKKLKISFSQNKARELEILVANAKNKLSEEDQELLDAFLELHIELAKDNNNKFLQKQLERMKKSFTKKLNEKEINDLANKQAEVIKLM
ncbi:hypothetical protein RclHR1_00760001 [Rhizophagus clarus]|uniref:Putative disease resistance protein RGA3 isoform X1 n=1 Tax=Rhizophagus clarus TaxID=94130 RepID=A0A2Z6RZC6_9GLOM|nr:hypothetical protein RclHR1_00760001 [Rhizophagus clarus]GES78891.1 putative disease resistance protein RGA3 isoform X1 [Rhizophagus clarus]